MKTIGKTAFTAALFSLALGTGAAHAADVPFENDFTSNGFTNSTANLTHDPAGTGTETYSHSGGTNATTALSVGSEQFSNAAGSSYVVSTDFQITSLGVRGGTGTGFYSVGLGLFGSNALFEGSGSTPWVFASWILSTGTGDPGEAVGRLNLETVGVGTTAVTTQGTANDNSSTVANQLNELYTLEAMVTNIGLNTYNISLALLDADGDQIGTSATMTGFEAWSEPVDGYYMGVRNRFPHGSAGTGTSTLEFENFAVIPEPASLALLGLGSVLMIARRRRQMA